MDETSPNLNLPFLQAAQAQKHVTHNLALERLDAVVQLVLQSFSQTTPPLAPDDGLVWAVGLGGVNDWAGHDGELAVWANGGWLFVTPRAGWRASLGGEIRIWDGSAWVLPDLPALQNLPGVGVNTSYDGTNRLAVSAAATLLTHEGAGHQLKLNKAAPADTGSLLFQTGWSGRAEMGLAGSDDFAIKVSADGSSWQTALSLQAASGRAVFDQGADLAAGSAGAPALGFAGASGTGLFLGGAGILGLAAGGGERARITASGLQVSGQISGTAVTQSATDTTAGRVLKVGDYGAGAAAGTVLFGRANILGTVSQAAGLPTGAVIERGSNVNGEYVRFADGTQICAHVFTGNEINTAHGTIFVSTSSNWTYPAVFAAGSMPITLAGTSLNDNRWVSARTLSNTAGQARQYRAVAIATLGDYQMLAVGRWF